MLGKIRIGGIRTFQNLKKNLANPRLTKKYLGISRLFRKEWIREVILGKIRFGGIRTFQKSGKKTLQIPGEKIPGISKVFFQILERGGPGDYTR